MLEFQQGFPIQYGLGIVICSFHFIKIVHQIALNLVGIDGLMAFAASFQQTLIYIYQLIYMPQHAPVVCFEHRTILFKILFHQRESKGKTKAVGKRPKL